MPISFVPYTEKTKEQRKLKPIVRFPIGLWSFDRAFAGYDGEVGLPLDALVELSGPSTSGKSTSIYSLAGIFASYLHGNIALVDLEGFNPEYMISILSHTSFEGNIVFCNGQNDEKSLDNLVEAMFKWCNVGILDSIAAISPLAEEEGDLGEANMGRRAKLMAQLSRKSVHMMNNSTSPKLIFMNNHQNPMIGMPKAVLTPGGVVKNYICTAIVRIKRKEEFKDGSYILEGKIMKNRYGYKGRVFYIFVLVGYGIHPGLTALYEGILLEKVKREREVISINGTSYGRLGDIVTKRAREANQDFFIPFHEILKDTHADDTNSDNSDEADRSSDDDDSQDQTADPS